MSSLDIVTSSVQGDLLPRQKHPRSHPHRLQHSSSLPNLWLPPHSGPIPPQLVNITRESLYLPATLPAIMAHPSLTNTPSSTLTDTRVSQTVDDGNKQVNNTGIDQKKDGAPEQYSEAKHYTDDHDSADHTLLTPPLTPSSSIRTTASIDSVALSHVSTAPTEPVAHDGKLEIGVQPTRFLLVGNVSRLADRAQIQSAICTALSCIDSRAFASSATLSAGNVSREVIKGLCCRLVAEAGIAMLAFFDLRVAECARQVLMRPNPLLNDCIAEGPARADRFGDEKHFSCDFATFEEMSRLSGKSSDFIQQMDSEFLLQVQARDPHDVPGNAVDEDERYDPAADFENNLQMLKSFLKSFGQLRTFELVEPSDAVSLSNLSHVFAVDYCDFRDANRAFSALDGDTLFRMDLRVFRPNRTRQGQQTKTTNSSDPVEESITAVTTGKSQAIDTPGLHSRMRERFVALGRDRLGHPRRRSASVENIQRSNVTVSTVATDLPVSLSPPDSSKAATPVCLYASPPISSSSVRASYAGSARGVAPSHIFFDAAGKPISSGDRELARWAYYPDADMPGSTAYPRDLQHPSSWYVGPHVETQEQADARSGDEARYYYPVPVTPGQPYYPALYNPGPGHGQMVYAGLPPSPRALAYAAYPPPGGVGIFPQSHPQSHRPTELIYGSPSTEAPAVWRDPASGVAFDPANASAAFCQVFGGGGAPPAPGTPNLAGDQQEYWAYASGFPQIQDNPHVMQRSPETQNSPRFQSRMQTQCRNLKPHAGGTYDHGLRCGSQISAVDKHDSSSPLGFSAEQDAVATSGKRDEPSRHGNGNNNNKLDIDKIAAGADTRTTVMIRNIPNKMSDTDLIAFINTVCPRRIDFLYLRMDFSNSCNVGYAFVNFITVEDLLLFAREKLGKKWNMFSSEKVLEMSYADYQSKESQVEKFKNSSIMDEIEEWRPKIFYSEPGPNQGLPEPFPAPTHLRRKQLSSHNRVGLYPSADGNGRRGFKHNIAGMNGRAQGGDPLGAFGDPPRRALYRARK